MTEDDIHILAEAGWFEARNGGPDSMRAVMHVVCNRLAAEGFPKTLYAVVFQPNAFSFTRPDNPEYHLDPTTSTGRDLEMWYNALLLAEDILKGDDPDPTLGALYYETPAATSGWFKRVIADDPVKHPFTIQIGGQNFYR